MDFKGKTALVTGSSGGIGRAIAVALAKKGSDVVLAARNEARLQEAKKEVEAFGRKALVVKLDQSSTKSVNEMKEKTLAAFGHIDILVNNAAVGIKGRLEAVSVENWEFIVNTNLLGYARCIQAFLPHFIERGSGHIVNVSSIQALGYPGQMANIPYIATKAGILGLTVAMTGYLAPKGIMVTCLFPGGTATDIATNAIFVGTEEEKKENLAKDAQSFKNPMFTKPETTAECLLAGMERGDFFILAPESLGDRLKTQGVDINILNAYLKKSIQIKS